MIIVEKKTNYIELDLSGDSDTVLLEFHMILKHLLNQFYEHGQEMLIFDKITDVITEFSDEHNIITKGEKKDD